MLHSPDSTPLLACPPPVLTSCPPDPTRHATRHATRAPCPVPQPQAIRKAHEATPLLAADARALEASLESLGIDGAWIKRGEMLNILIDLASAQPPPLLSPPLPPTHTHPTGPLPARLSAPNSASRPSQAFPGLPDPPPSPTDALLPPPASAAEDDPAAGAASARGVSYSEEELRTVFDAIDTDGSGDIDLGELRAAITQISPDADEATIQKMLTIADADGSGEVDFDEFKKLFGVAPAVAA